MTRVSFARDPRVVRECRSCRSRVSRAVGGENSAFFKSLNGLLCLARKIANLSSSEGELSRRVLSDFGQEQKLKKT